MGSIDLVRIGGVIVASLVAMTVLFGSWYTVAETQRGALLRNGAFVRTVTPGLGFKIPLIDDVEKIDTKTHTTVWKNMEAYSADQQPAHLQVSVTYRVSPDQIKDFYARFGDDLDAAVSRSIGPRVPDRVKVVFGQFTAARAISERGKLNNEASEALRLALAYDPVFVIESVQIEDMKFSSEYIRSVEQRMQAEVEVLRYRQQLEREKVQAQIAVTQAQGRADSVLAEAKAQADATKLRGDAEAQAIRARSEALGQNPSLVSLVQAERWNGVLPTTMLPGGAVPMLTLDRPASEAPNRAVATVQE